MSQESSNVWKVFIRNKIALSALLLILAAFLLSLIAYLIIPDNSHNANEQFPTISLKSPGFHADILQVKKNSKSPRLSLWQKLVHGHALENDNQVYLKLDYNQKDLVLTNHYKRKQVISYPDIVYKLDNTKESTFLNGIWTIYLLDESPVTITQENLLKEVKQKITTRRFLLGTDKFGRDIFSRLILGIRISIFVGLVAVFISVIVGIFIGAMGGYYGGKIDQLVMLFINVSWSIPTLLMVFAIVLAFDRGISVIFIAVGLTMWVEVARIVRGQVQTVKNEQYIMAAKSMGFKTPKIIFQHILPNIIGPILVVATANFSTAVLVEAGLSYLGFGVEPPTPSIGNMLNEHYGYALTGKVFLAIVPAITIMILVLSFNLVGTGLRDAFDVKRQET